LAENPPATENKLELEKIAQRIAQFLLFTLVKNESGCDSFFLLRFFGIDVETKE
jgi:hypothetical protein